MLLFRKKHLFFTLDLGPASGEAGKLVPDKLVLLLFRKHHLFFTLGLSPASGEAGQLYYVKVVIFMKPFQVSDQHSVYFLTLTIEGWLDIFTRKDIN